MADWDKDSPELQENLKRVLTGIRDEARRRVLPSLDLARRWHKDTMQGLAVPDPALVGAFRGERGLERKQVHVGPNFGVPANGVNAALSEFEGTLRAAVQRLDELIPPESELDEDRFMAVLTLCAWVHAEWVRIHPFVNGNGRVARLWVNSLAMRHGLPPFLQARPRPTGDYELAGVRAMHGDWAATIPVLRRLYDEFTT